MRLFIVCTKRAKQYYTKRSKLSVCVISAQNLDFIRCWTSFLSHVHHSMIMWLQLTKMKAGCSRLKPAVFIYSFILCFYTSYPLTAQPVRILWVNIRAVESVNDASCPHRNARFLRLQFQRRWVGMLSFITFFSIVMICTRRFVSCVAGQFQMGPPWASFAPRPSVGWTGAAVWDLTTQATVNASSRKNSVSINS